MTANVVLYERMRAAMRSLRSRGLMREAWVMHDRWIMWLHQRRPAHYYEFLAL